MQEKLLDNTRMAAAKGAIKNLVKGLPADMSLGLRVFTDCSSINALAPIKPIDKPAFIRLIEAVEPKGGTPIVASLLQSFEALRAIPDVERISVIVTDGGESCSGVFSEVIQMAREMTIKVIVIAFDIDNAAITSSLRQLAEASGGAFIDAQDGAELQRALEASLQRISYELYAPGGKLVHRGFIGGDRLELPLGTYEVRFGFSSMRLSTPVTLAALAESTVTLRGKGRALTAAVTTQPR
jgi:Ca-activated chloride channel family protein